MPSTAWQRGIAKRTSARVNAVIFDLETAISQVPIGTSGDRTPDHILGLVRQGADPLEWRVPMLSQLPAALVARGYRVGVTSPAPRPFVNTLLWLLGIGYDELRAGSQEGLFDTGSRLASLAESFRTGAGSMVFISGAEGDAEQAARSRVRFVDPRELLDHPSATVEHLLGRLPLQEIGGPGSPWRPRLDPDRWSATYDSALDRAVAAATKGAATKEQRRLLTERGQLSCLLAGGYGQLVDPSAQSDTAGNPPWWRGTAGDWTQLLESGDVGRLLDMDPTRVRARVPDPALDRMLADAAQTGLYGTVLHVLDGLDPIIAKHIKRPPPPVHPEARLLAGERIGLREARALAAAVPDENTSAPVEQYRAALALAALYSGTCNLPARRILQHVALTGMPPDALTCLVGLPHGEPAVSFPFRHGLNPHLAERSEYDSDPELRSAVLTMLARVLPLRDVTLAEGVHGDPPVQAAVGYRSWLGDRTLIQAKDWGRHGDLTSSITSGSRVHLGLMELPALVLAANVHAQSPSPILVSAAPTEYSSRRPAELSRWLARRVGELVDTAVELDLAKDAGSEQRTRLSTGEPQPRILIDDQVTRGRRIRLDAMRLRVRGTPVARAIAWSSSALDGPSQAADCWLHSSMSPLGLIVECPSHPPSSD